MSQILIRFFIGGAVVSVFAALGDVLKPKSFAGLFAAAPSVALATLGLTLTSHSADYTAIEARSMVVGAIALFTYASFVSWIMMRYNFKALLVTTCSIVLWFVVAFSVARICLR
jgi:hypothetical protein